MMLQCRCNFDGELHLTIGKIYENKNLDLIDWDIVLIVNDLGVEQTYNVKHFFIKTQE